MKNIGLFVIFISAMIVGGCGNQPAANTSKTNTNQNATVVNTAKVQATPEPAADVPSSLSLATPTEAYKTAYELRKNKDIAGLKKIMSPDVLEFMTMMGEGEKKSLDDMLKEMCDKPQADKPVARNENIKGDRAVVEYLTETGGWKTMDFEKVDGKWLLSLPSSDGPEPNK